MAETSTIFGFMKYVSATDILSDFKKTVDSHFVNSLNRWVVIQRFYLLSQLLTNFKNVQYTYLTKFTNVYLYILTKMRNVSLKHFGDSVVTFKKPISSIKSSLFFHYISFIYHHKKKRLTKVSQLLKLRFRILTLNKITNI